MTPSEFLVLSLRQHLKLSPGRAWYVTRYALPAAVFMELAQRGKIRLEESLAPAERARLVRHRQRAASVRSLIGFLIGTVVFFAVFFSPIGPHLSQVLHVPLDPFWLSFGGMLMAFVAVAVSYQLRGSLSHARLIVADPLPTNNEAYDVALRRLQDLGPPVAVRTILRNCAQRFGGLDLAMAIEARLQVSNETWQQQAERIDATLRNPSAPDVTSDDLVMAIAVSLGNTTGSNDLRFNFVLSGVGWSTGRYYTAESRSTNTRSLVSILNGDPVGDIRLDPMLYDVLLAIRADAAQLLQEARSRRSSG